MDKKKPIKDKLQEVSTNSNQTLSLTLNFEKARQFAHFIRAKEDLNYVIECCELLHEIESKKSFKEGNLSNHDRLTRQSLYFSLIFTYAKCFADNSRGKTTGKLEKRDHLKGAGDDTLNIHDELIEIRHNYLAHGTENSNEYIVAKLYFYPTEDEYTISTKLGYEGLRAFSSSIENLVKIKELAEIVIGNLNKKLEKLKKAVMDEISKEPIENWVLKAAKEVQATTGNIE
ncbi:hypothetical protein [Fulvivirga lutimaris]|uniref:hypothetical protein n=1 Tax=Fulvivirga lutimaris TaxID=1819566 RepID=UPI0012BCF998|nr:hypothetical protein [Fulvivirga lutimaris]MTI39998.1 hypothetical protein [Fulvivirga lutimaris]